MPSDAIAAATALTAEARYAEALKRIDTALTEAPGNLDLLFGRAMTLFGWGRYRESMHALFALERLGRTGSAFYMQLGWACLWSGELVESERWMRKAVEANADDWAPRFGLASALQAQRKNEDARAEFQRALDLKQDDPYCLANLVGCELTLNHADAAERLARRAVEIVPESAVAWSNLGVALDHQDRYSEALAAFAKAEQLSVNAGELQYDYVNHAICLLRDARTREGLALLESKLPRHPSVMGHSHYSLSLLLSGRMREGWDQYEFRWIDGPLKSARSDFSSPAWDGQDLRGKTILVRSEQGLGDFIQFIRYASHVKVLGATVLLHAPEAVRQLASCVTGIDHVLVPDKPYPPLDFFVNLLSLPRIFGTEIATIPAKIPYLRVNAELAAKWRARLGDSDTLKIGLVWAGSPTHLRDKFRSLSLNALGPLCQLPGVSFFSLQKGPAASQLQESPIGPNIIDLGPELNDFTDTAAAISQLDLVLCVDTSVAHLAGAIGRPVWLMLPRPCDWRWLEDRGDSPWYPTMRLFRQKRVGDWSDVLDQVATALEGPARNELLALRVTAATYSSKENTNVPLAPLAGPVHRLGKVSAAAYTITGALQYWPEQYPVGPSISYYGEYLQPQLELLGRLVQPGATVMEVGSGIGAHAVFLGKAIGPAGHLFVYEPRPTMQAVLRQNLSSHGIAKVTIMRNAAGFSRESDPDGEWPSVAQGSTPNSPRPEVTVETIDDLQLERLHWLKINEHDFPTGVVRGAIQTLWKLRPLLFVAQSEERALAELATIVRECSYRTWQLKTPLFNRANFNRRDHDIFSNAFALALLAVPEEIDMDIALDQCIEVL